MRFNQQQTRVVPLLMLSLVLGITGLMLKPHKPEPEKPDKPCDIIVVTDVSFSMAAQDVDVERTKDFRDGTRLDLAASITLQQVIQLIDTGSQVGLVTYMGNGFLALPLTADRALAEKQTRSDFRIGCAPGNGGNISSGLMAACRTFNHSRPGVPRVIVVFSDGGSTDDDAELEEAVSACRQGNIKVVVVGLGGNSPSQIWRSVLPLDAQAQFPPRPMLTAFDGGLYTPLVTARDESFLFNLAARLNGTYVPVNSAADRAKLVQLLP